MATDNPAKEHNGRCVVRSATETAALARNLVPCLRKACVVSLEGPLGAGKTHFVKAVAEALGVTDVITSPTFTLLQSYGGAENRIHHSDWYRLESEREVLALALEDYYGEGIFFIEWGDKFPNLLPPGTLRIRIGPLEKGSDDSRKISWNQAHA